jgi:hypothetical protein
MRPHEEVEDDFAAEEENKIINEVSASNLFGGRQTHAD